MQVKKCELYKTDTELCNASADLMSNLCMFSIVSHKIKGDDKNRKKRKKKSSGRNPGIRDFLYGYCININLMRLQDFFPDIAGGTGCRR